MANLKVVRIVRSGKFHSRVETSDGHQLVLDNANGKPFIGMELDIEGCALFEGEVRPLKPTDKYPELINGDF